MLDTLHPPHTLTVTVTHECHGTREQILETYDYMETNQKLLSYLLFVLYKCPKGQHCIISNKHVERLEMMPDASFVPHSPQCYVYDKRNIQP